MKAHIYYEDHVQFTPFHLQDEKRTWFSIDGPTSKFRKPLDEWYVEVGESATFLSTAEMTSLFLWLARRLGKRVEDADLASRQEEGQQRAETT